jgi:hypothetical protein
MTYTMQSHEVCLDVLFQLLWTTLGGTRIFRYSTDHTNTNSTPRILTKSMFVTYDILSAQYRVSRKSMDERNLIYMSHSTTPVINVHHTKPLGHAFINAWIMPNQCRTPCHLRRYAHIRVQVQEAWGLTLEGPMGSKCGYTHNSYKPHQVFLISLKKI